MDIFKLVGSVFVDTDKANDSLSKTDKKASGVGNTLLKGVETAGKFAVGLTAACAAGAAALFGVANKAASATDNIDKMSQKIGISREAYQELDFICSQSGASVDNLKAGMKTLTNQMQSAESGSETATAAFKELGLSWTDGSGKLKDQETMMWEAFSALQSMEDQTKKAALANDLFGKAGTELMPMLNSTSGSIDEMKQKAHDLGLVLSDESVDSGVKFTDTLDQAQRSLSSIVTKIGVGVMPIFQSALDWVLDNMPMIQSVFESVFGVIETVVTIGGNAIQTVFSYISQSLNDSGITFQDVMSSIQSITSTAFKVIQDIWNHIGLPVFNYIKSNLGVVAEYFSEKMPEIQNLVSNAFSDIQDIWNNNLKPCFDAIGNFLNNVLAPIFEFVFKNIIAPVIDSVFKTIGELWNNSLKPIFENIIDFVKNIFTANFSGAFKNVINIVGGIWKGIISVVKTPINSVIGIINKFIGGLNKLKIPDWVPLVGGNKINIKEIPLLAKGGNVIGEGHAVVGEAGAELINLPAGAKVTPLTSGNGDVLGTESIMKVLYLILDELRGLNAELYDKIVKALIDGVEIDWNNRELARLVRRYA